MRIENLGKKRTSQKKHKPSTKLKKSAVKTYLLFLHNDHLRQQRLLINRPFRNIFAKHRLYVHWLHICRFFCCDLKKVVKSGILNPLKNSELSRKKEIHETTKQQHSPMHWSQVSPLHRRRHLTVL